MSFARVVLVLVLLAGNVSESCSPCSVVLVPALARRRRDVVAAVVGGRKIGPVELEIVATVRFGMWVAWRITMKRRVPSWTLRSSWSSWFLRLS